MVRATDAQDNSATRNGKPKIVATYDYRDERGQLLFQSVRREPGADGAKKDFRQCRPDGKGGRTWNLQGVRLVPYRLPELLAADPGRPVCVAEGEKDADNLAAIDLIATTNPMGAGKWKADYNQYFQGRRVIILPDNDEVGKKHAATVADNLRGVAASVLTVELPGLPAKGDVSDWLAIPGNGKEKLLELVYARANAEGHGHGDAWEGDQAGLKCHDMRPQDAKPALGFRWNPIDSAAFAVADYRPAWLAKKALVEKQIAVIGGPQKVLKTSLAVDLAVSLASGTAWLGEFACPPRKRVTVLSGESGPWALQAIARRVCEAKGIDLAGLGVSLCWQFTLPQLALPDQLDALRAGLERDRAEVSIFDPLYLCLLAGADGPRAENLYDTGPLLLRVAQTCLNAGATPILLHHCTKPSARKLEPLDLADLAFSGVGEFARQWVLISRREAYDPDTGKHRLWLSVGGSVGHGGLWAVDVDEGQLAEDFTGRKWEVTVNTAGDARQRQAQDKEQAKREREGAAQQVDAKTVLHALDVSNPDRGGVSFTSLRDASGLSPRRFGAAVVRLKDAGEIEEYPGTATVGKGAQKGARIIRRRSPEAMLFDQPINRPDQPSTADG